MQHTTPSSRRRPRLWTALLAICVVIVSPILGVTAAQAGAPGYEGQASGTPGSWADDFLELMTKGVAYSDTIQAPEGGGPYDWSVDGLPAGLSYDDDNDLLTISGTPTVDGSFEFTVTVNGGDGASWHLDFTGTIGAGATLATTTTTLDPVDASAYYPLRLTASVTGTDPTGQVQFYANGEPIGDPQNLSDGVVSYNGSGIENSSLVGSRATFTARYLGDANNAESTSDPITTFIYYQGDVFGNVYDSGNPVDGATVDLLLAPATTSETPEYSMSTDSNGSYLFNIQPSTQVNAEKTYVIRVTFPDDTVLYFDDDADTETQSSTDIADADATGPVTWLNKPYSVYRIPPEGIGPTWSDDTIGSLQQGAAFTDGVSATGDPTIVYGVSAGILPDGLTLDAATGAITGTPTVDGEFDFTVRARNDFGEVTQQFTGTIATAVDPDLGLTLDFAPGSSIGDASTTIQASGLKVGSTYTLVLHSAPVTLYVGTVDATGGFSLPVALPPGIPAGSHSLVLTGIAPDGSVLTSTGWFSIDANGKVLKISMTGPIEGLAFTGMDVTPGLIFGGSLFLAGVLFFSAARFSRRISWRRAARNS